MHAINNACKVYKFSKKLFLSPISKISAICRVSVAVSQNIEYIITGKLYFAGKTAEI